MVANKVITGPGVVSKIMDITKPNTADNTPIVPAIHIILLNRLVNKLAVEPGASFNATCSMGAVKALNNGEKTNKEAERSA